MDYIRTEADGQLAFTQSSDFLLTALSTGHYTTKLAIRIFVLICL